MSQPVAQAFQLGKMRHVMLAHHLKQPAQSDCACVLKHAAPLKLRRRKIFESQHVRPSRVFESIQRGLKLLFIIKPLLRKLSPVQIRQERLVLSQNLLNPQSVAVKLYVSQVTDILDHRKLIRGRLPARLSLIQSFRQTRDFSGRLFKKTREIFKFISGHSFFYLYSHFFNF